MGGPNLQTVANWATPAAQEPGGTAEQFLDRKRANGTCGVSLTALSLQAQTASAGQLNPALSRRRIATAAFIRAYLDIEM